MNALNGVMSDIFPTNSHPERINKQDKKIDDTLDYRGINFSMKARDYELVDKKIFFFLIGIHLMQG